MKISDYILYFVKRIMNIGIFLEKIFRVVKFKDSVFAWVIYRKDVEQVNNFRTVFYDDSFHMALHKTWAVFMMILLTWHYIKQERYLHNSNS